MKFLKKVLAAVACVCVLATSVTLTSHAAGGRISFADPSTAVGDMVDVKCVLKSSSGSLGSSSVTLSYDASALKFNSGDGVTGGDGTLTYSGNGGSSEVSFTMTFQALQEGSTEITVASQDVKSSSGSEVKLTEGKSTVTIAAGDPSKIVDDTQAAEGADTAASGDVTVEVNGTSYTLSDFVEASVPAGFTKTTMNYEGADRPMAYNETNGIYLAYLTSADGNSNFFLYDDSNATFAPYEEIDISDTTTIVLLSDTSVKLPSNYAQTTLTLNGQEFPVWQDNDKDGFSKSKSDGSIDLESRLTNYVSQQRYKAIQELAEEEGIDEEALIKFLNEYDFLQKEKPEILQEAVKKKRIGLKERRTLLKRIMDKLHSIIELFNWE